MRIYHGDDVGAPYVRLQDGPFRGAWCRAVHTDASYRRLVEDSRYLPSILAWHRGYALLWSDLSTRDQRALENALESSEGVTVKTRWPVRPAAVRT